MVRLRETGLSRMPVLAVMMTSSCQKTMRFISMARFNNVSLFFESD